VFGLDSFSVKLSEAAKLFGKKFASGAAVVKSPTEKEQIDIQGDCLEKVTLLDQLAGNLLWIVWPRHTLPLKQAPLDAFAMCIRLMLVLQLPDFILKNYGESKGITKADIWYIAEKRCAAVLRAISLNKR
jgi:Translation initiation factor SUI1